MPLTNVLKKRLMKGESTQSGSSRWVALGLILSMTACTSITAADNRQPVVGLNVNQFAGGSFDAAGQAFTKELGVHSIRVGYNHGNHNFGVNWAAQNGMGVVFMLGYSVGCNPATVAGRQCYADRSAGLAQKYGNKVQYYEVWNEWNIGLGHGGPRSCANQSICADTAMYTDLLCRTYKAIKAVQPNAKVVSSVTSGTDLTWNGRVFDAGGGKCMDAISVHPYVYLKTKFSVPHTSPGSVGADKFVEAITAVNDLIKSKNGGRSIPILVTEEGRANGSSPQITADYLTEVYKRAKSIPFLEGIWWYSLKESSPGRFGLLSQDNTKKPGFFALQAAAQE